MIRDMHKRNLENTAILILMMTLAFIFLLKSPLHPWIGADSGTDSSVFRTVAQMIERGYLPYRDTFDHKGPLLYAINYIGNKISPQYGIWGIEFVFMTVTFFALYKISRLKCHVGFSLIVTMVSISLLFQYFEGGNMTEEYAMPLIAVSIYIFLDYFINQKITKMRLFSCGFCFGATLMLRPNMISVWVVFCIYVLVYIAMNKSWDKLSYFVLWFFLGMSIIVVPIVIWLAINNDLSACWESYVIFNKKYTSGDSRRAMLANEWSSYFFFFNTIVFVLSFCTIAYLCKIKKKELDRVYLIYMLITLLFICLSGREYNHYGMILIPAVAYPIASFASEIESIQSEHIVQILSTIIGIYFLSTIVLPNWLELVSSIPTTYVNKEEEHRSGLALNIRDIICEHTTEADSISVYGNWDYLYIVSERKHATRYSYQFPIGQVMPELMEEYMEQLEEEQPIIIVIEDGHFDDNIRTFLDDNQYNLVWSQNGDTMNGALVYAK